MTPFTLFLYLTACAGGLFVVGCVGCLLILVYLYLRGILSASSSR